MKANNIIGIIYIIMIFLLIFNTDKILIGCKNKAYTEFRDKSYKDYSKDKEYQIWLIRHPKKGK